jgi:hypothetical protein
MHFLGHWDLRNRKRGAMTGTADVLLDIALDRPIFNVVLDPSVMVVVRIATSQQVVASGHGMCKLECMGLL